MGLLSLFKNNMQKQDTPEDADSGEFHSRAEQESKPARANGKRATPNRKAKVVDPILPEKKRARRRLIGAVALVLAAVIGLPMVLDSEPKPNVDDISVQIPSKDKAPALVEPVGQAANPAVVVTKDKPLGTDSVEEIIAPTIKTSSDAPVKSALPTVQSEQKLEAQKSDSTVENNPLVSTASKSAIKANIPVAQPESPSKGSKKPEATDDASRALAILEGKTAVKATAKEKATSSYTIQVAALATQEKVNELQSALKAANIKSYTQKIVTVSGQVTRVRVGPFDSKDEAEKMRAKLEKIGLTGKLVPN
jgi:DedD protein